MQNKRFSSRPKEVAVFFDVSLAVVRQWVDTQMFRYGKHYIDVRSPNAKNSKLRFDLEACQKYFETEPEKR